MSGHDREQRDSDSPGDSDDGVEFTYADAEPVTPGNDPLDDEAGVHDQPTPLVDDEVDGQAHTIAEQHRDRDVADPDARASCRFCEQEFRTRVAERRHHCRDRRDLDLRSVESQEAVLEPGIHELGSKFLFVPEEKYLSSHQDGMAPYFGIVSEFDRCLKGDDGQDDVGALDVADETWVLDHEEDNIKYWQGSIATREQDSGDAYYEYQIGLRATDDVGEKTIGLQFRPALPDAAHAETGEPIKSLPDDLPHGVRVQINSSNVEPGTSIDVLQALMAKMDVDPGYFAPENIHPWSRVYNLALYIRIAREIGEDAIIGPDGTLERFARFSSARRGRGEFKWDNEEIVGHRQAVAMNETALEKFYDGHDVGKLFKYYHPKLPRASASNDNPLSNPKLEVQFSTEYSDLLDGNAVPWSDHDGFDYDDLRAQLDEALLFAVSASDLPLDADEDVYVRDEYWTPTATERDIDLHADPTDELLEAEEDLVRAQFARDDLTNSDRAVIRALADGGRAHYQDLVDETDTSSSTVYRAIEKFGSLVERVGRGTYDLADDVVRQKVNEVFQALEDVTEWVENGIDAIVDRSDEIAQGSAFAKWARRHGAVLSDHYDGLEVELVGQYSKHELQEVLRAGLHAARRTGSKTAAKLIDASVTYNLNGEQQTGEPFQYHGSALAILGAPVDRR